MPMVLYWSAGDPMKFFKILIFSLVALNTVSANSEVGDKQIFYGGAKIEVGLDCDKRSSSLLVLFRITNSEKNNLLFFYPRSVNLSIGNPNVFVLIPWRFKGESDRLKYAAKYTMPIDISADYESKVESRFVLNPGEKIVIKNLVSRYYDINIFERYAAISFFSFLDSSGNLKYISFEYELNPVCFSDNKVIWLSDILLAESKTLNGKNQ
jgi:hypothetical protein